MQELRWNAAHEICAAERLQRDIRERFLSFMARDLCTYRLEKALAAPGCRIQARCRSVGGFTVTRIATSEAASRFVRRAEEISGDGRHEFALLLLLSGDATVSQFGRTLHMSPGSYALAAWSHPIIQESSRGPAESICFVMPRSFVDRRMLVGEDLCVRPYDVTAGLHRLAFETVKLFQENAGRLSDEDFEKSARAVGDLVVLAVGADAPDISSADHSVRAAHLLRAKHIIRERLSDADLTLEAVAQELGLSLRYVHKLFRDEGRTMYEYLKSARLQRARELLELSSSRKMTITEVALECGFSGMSHFSRSFKEAFGLSPQDVVRHD
jgi:AraC-like DNA-binding protein